MPNLPFNPPVTLDELYRNINHDVGAPPTANSSYDSVSLHGLLSNLDYGVYKSGLAIFGSGVDCTVTAGAEVPLTFTALANGAGSVTLWNTTTITASANIYTLTQDLWLSDQATIALGRDHQLQWVPHLLPGEVDRTTAPSNRTASPPRPTRPARRSRTPRPSRRPQSARQAERGTPRATRSGSTTPPTPWVASEAPEATATPTTAQQVVRRPHPQRRLNCRSLRPGRR